jgi:hypothetical protein
MTILGHYPAVKALTDGFQLRGFPQQSFWSLLHFGEHVCLTVFLPEHKKEQRTTIRHTIYHGDGHSVKPYQLAWVLSGRVLQTGDAASEVRLLCRDFQTRRKATLTYRFNAATGLFERIDQKVAKLRKASRMKSKSV